MQTPFQIDFHASVPCNLSGNRRVALTQINFPGHASCEIRQVRAPIAAAWLAWPRARAARQGRPPRHAAAFRPGGSPPELAADAGVRIEVAPAVPEPIDAASLLASLAPQRTHGRDAPGGGVQKAAAAVALQRRIPLLLTE